MGHTATGDLNNDLCVNRREVAPETNTGPFLVARLQCQELPSGKKLRDTDKRARAGWQITLMMLGS